MKLFRILLLTFFTYTLISCGGAEERKSVYMEKAKASIAAGDLEKARIELKNVLQIDPKDGEAYYQLGSVYEQKKDYRKAYGNYLKAEELSPELLENHAKLGRFYLLLMKDTDKAQDKIDLILSKESNNPDGLLLKAAALLQDNKTNEAVAIVEGIIKNEKKNVEAVIFLARLYVKDKKDNEAIDLIDDALVSSPDNGILSRFLAKVLVKNKMYERAEFIYKSFLEKKPDSALSYNDLAVFYNKAGDNKKAENVLRTSIENDSNDVNRQLALVKYVLTTKSKDEGAEELKTLISKNKRKGKLRLALAELYLLSDKKELAKDIYIGAIKDFSEEFTGIQSRTALSRIYINEKDFISAEKIIEEAIAISPNEPKVNFIRAKFAVQNKDFEKAIIALRIVTKETPDNVEAFIMLSEIFKLEESEEQASATLNDAFEANKVNAEGLLKLSQYYAKSDLYTAEKVIDQYNKIKPPNYEGLSIKAAILNKNKQQLEAFNLAKKLMDDYPGKANGYLQAVPYYGKAKDEASAVSVLEKGYLNVKGNRNILTLLTSLQLKQKKFDVVKKRINAEIESAPDDAQLRIMLAKVSLASNEPGVAEKILNKVTETKSDLEEPYLLLSNIYQNKKDLKAVKAILTKGVLNTTGGLKIGVKLASLHEHEGSYKTAITVYKEINNENQNNLLIINNLASLLSDYGDGKDDLVLAKTLSVKLEGKGQSAFQDTVGWVHYKLGDFEKAIQYLSKATEESPEINVFNYHLGMAYILSGDKVQAKDYLEKSLADEATFKEREKAKVALKGLK